MVTNVIIINTELLEIEELETKIAPSGMWDPVGN